MTRNYKIIWMNTKYHFTPVMLPLSEVTNYILEPKHGIRYIIPSDALMDGL